MSLVSVRRSLGTLFLLLALPGMVNAAGVMDMLPVTDSKAVTRAEFIRAVVKAAELPTKDVGPLSFDAVPDALAPFVRAADARGALTVFSKEGKKVNFQRTISRGEALAVLAAVLDAAPSADKLTEAQQYKDASTQLLRTAVAVALERNWMKPVRPTIFGVVRPLRGREAKLLLSRAFQTAIPEQPKETFSIPVIRVNLTGTSRQPVPKQDLLEEVWNLLRRNYLYQEKLEADKVGDKAIEGLVNSLGDPYSTYMPKSRNEDFQLQIKGEVEGIGATVEMTGGVLTIVSPLRSSPAEKAGLLPKDQILSVNGEKLQGLTLDEAVRKVRGPKGSEALLRVRRGDKEFDVTVVRERVVIPEVEVTFDRNVAVVRILQFWDTTDKKFRTVMTEVQTRSPRAVILDLRNNPGGLLHAAGTVVGTLLPKGSSYVSIMERDETRSEVTVDEPVIKDTIPVIVLVNKGSASASEIVAGALQDTKRARIVGETTYGKGTVQQVVQFTDGSSLKFTVAEWRTPSGKKIDKLGVKPDIEVVNVMKGRDDQLEKAFDLLR